MYTSFFMKTKFKRTTLKFISKRKFHLIPIAIRLRASLDALPLPGLFLPFQRPLQQLLHLSLLDLKLLLIRQGQISAASAYAKMGTRFAGFQRG